MSCLNWSFSSLVDGSCLPGFSRLNMSRAWIRMTTYGTWACCASSRLARSIESANRRSSGKGSGSLRSPNSESGFVSQTPCSPAKTRSLPRNPREVTRTRGISSSPQIPPSWTACGSVSWHAMTIWNFLKNSTPWPSTWGTSRSSNSPWTSGFISCSQRLTASARSLPRSDSSRKKLCPRSAGSTRARSTTVKWPIPGSTKFFRVSVATAVEPSMQSFVSMSAFCP
mmetsp:Transcript_33035/g.87315  ORF Transcript_33035/g.87315 Transcript_33035/m.87315 type:complete len:226 (-) Transcript_33035:16-693(-)